MNEPKSSAKVEKMLASKVTAKNMWMQREPDLHHKLALELAIEIHESRSTDCAVSWEAQVEAMNYFNENGFGKTLDYMMDLRKKNRVKNA